nr:hypothetical protein [Tanacetum cinerariifolium]
MDSSVFDRIVAPLMESDDHIPNDGAKRLVNPRISPFALQGERLDFENQRNWEKSDLEGFLSEGRVSQVRYLRDKLDGGYLQTPLMSNEHVDNLAFNLLSVGKICGNKCRVLFTKDGSEITKDRKVIEYSQNIKACIILNKHTMKVEESLNVIFDENPLPTKLSPLVDADDDVGEDEAIENKVKVNNFIEKESLEVDEVVNI